MSARLGIAVLVVIATLFGSNHVAARYAKIKVEEGAELSGEISMLDKAQNAVRKAA